MASPPGARRKGKSASPRPSRQCRLLMLRLFVVHIKNITFFVFCRRVYLHTFLSLQVSVFPRCSVDVFYVIALFLHFVSWLGYLLLHFHEHKVRRIQLTHLLRNTNQKMHSRNIVDMYWSYTREGKPSQFS